MAPPTTRPRLSKIDPDALALSVARAVADHVWSVRHNLLRAPGDDAMGDGYDDARLAASEVARAVRYIARYAQDGTPPDDGAPVAERMITLVPLWSAPLGEAPADISDADQDTDLGCVLRAATARQAVMSRVGNVSPGDLAVLAGVEAMHVRHLLRSGEIRGTMESGGGWLVKRPDARRWLAARGVPGFAS